jgi:DNA-binding transcriptional ArsR family regulator
VTRRELPPGDQIDLAVETFRMLADATRIRLLWALLDDESSVGDLAKAVGRPQAAVSQHLAKLRMARLVLTRRAGTQTFYRIENEHVRQLVEDAVFHADHAGGGIPLHHSADAHVTEIPGPTAQPTPMKRRNTK